MNILSCTNETQQCDNKNKYYDRRDKEYCRFLRLFAFRYNLKNMNEKDKSYNNKYWS